MLARRTSGPGHGEAARHKVAHSISLAASNGSLILRWAGRRERAGLSMIDAIRAPAGGRGAPDTAGRKRKGGEGVKHRCPRLLRDACGQTPHVSRGCLSCANFRIGQGAGYYDTKSFLDGLAALCGVTTLCATASQLGVPAPPNPATFPARQWR